MTAGHDDGSEPNLFRTEAAPASRPSRASGRSDDGGASHAATLELFQAGRSVEEIAEERALSRVTVENHLMRCADEGAELDWSRIIPDDQEPLILEADSIDSAAASCVLSEDALPPEVDYFAIHGVIRKHGLGLV